MASRIRFGKRRAIDLALAVLVNVEEGLNEALRLFPLMPGAKGGRKPLVHRDCLMVNLAMCWSGLGRAPTTGANSEFVAFCEVVIDAIGWPFEGVEASVPSVIKLWRNLTQKS